MSSYQLPWDQSHVPLPHDDHDDAEPSSHSASQATDVGTTASSTSSPPPTTAPASSAALHDHQPHSIMNPNPNLMMRRPAPSAASQAAEATDATEPMIDAGGRSSSSSPYDKQRPPLAGVKRHSRRASTLLHSFTQRLSVSSISALTGGTKANKASSQPTSSTPGGSMRQLPEEESGSASASASAQGSHE